MKMNFKILKPSASFHGVGYSERKLKKGDAELIYFDNFGHLQDGRENITRKEAEAYLTKYSKRNKWIKKPQFHAVITCKGQEATDEELKEYALKVMDKLGYADVPIMMYSHNDTGNKHVHIVTSRIAQDGKKIAHDMEGATANRILSRLLNNSPVENLKNDLENALSYNFSTIAQFYLLLENKEYDIKEIGDKTYFFKHGQQQGEIEKAILFDKIASNKLSLKNPAQLRALLHKYGAIYSPVLKKIDNIHYTTSKTKYGSDLTNYLKEKFGFDFIFFNGKAGTEKTFGYAIIDHKNKIVYKGSEVMKLDELINLGKSNSKKVQPDLAIGNLEKDVTNRDATEEINLKTSDNELQLGKVVNLNILLDGDKNIQSPSNDFKRRRKRKNNFF